MGVGEIIGLLPNAISMDALAHGRIAKVDDLEVIGARHLASLLFIVLDRSRIPDVSPIYLNVAIEL